MPTLSILFESDIFAHLAKAGSDDTIHVTLALGGGAGAAAPVPVVPRGPLAGIMKAGLLEPGTVLTFHQPRVNRKGRAVVTADGQLIVNGHSSPFPSPSKAAGAVTGNFINGWTLWHLPDGRTLDEVRDELKRTENV
ncbi:restriction system modified-DNA reader domain-containing protein [Streptomyces xantholiticus]